MSIHLFSTPVECTQCGTVVDDPTTDHCPNCGAILRERRTPRRLAGVEKRYSGLRLLVGSLRFLGIITLLIGVLIFAFGVGEDTMTAPQGILTLLGGVLVAVVLFSVAAFFEVMLDMEENTRASFRLQQMILDELQEEGVPPPAQPD